MPLEWDPSVLLKLPIKCYFQWASSGITKRFCLRWYGCVQIRGPASFLFKGDPTCPKQFVVILSHKWWVGNIFPSTYKWSLPANTIRSLSDRPFSEEHSRPQREPPWAQLGRTRGSLWHFTVETCSGCWLHQCGDSLTVDSFFKTDVLTSKVDLCTYSYSKTVSRHECICPN